MIETAMFVSAAALAILSFGMFAGFALAHMRR